LFFRRVVPELDSHISRAMPRSPAVRSIALVATVTVLCDVLAPLALPVAAQTSAPDGGRSSPVADSAAMARAAYGRAIAAYRKKDIATARTEMARAAAAWPTQQAYLENSLGLAALAHDTVDVARWLDRLAGLGIGRGAPDDSSFRRLAGAPVYEAALQRLKAATAPVPRSHVRLTLADTLLYPEGVAFDSRTARWFVGSVRQRRIVVVERDGTAHDFVRPAADGIGGVFGMAVDEARRTLWVATTSLARMQDFAVTDSGRVGVYGYDIDTGRLRRHVWAPRDSSVSHTFGDVAVAPNGDVYASDSQAPWIFRLAAGGDSLERFATHPLFRSLQGMAVTPDGATMYVADYSHGLMRLDLRSRSVTPLRVPPNVTLLGVDGLYLHRGALIGVQNGVAPARIARFCLDADGGGVRRLETIDRNPALADEPTLGVVVGDSLFYVATSQWDKFDDAGARVAGSALRPATVLGVALDDKTACHPERAVGESRDLL
jgi:sugar lactone lactonase YvrE